jgi:hypothetical protein
MYASAQAEHDLERERLRKEVTERQAEIDSAKKDVEDAKKERADTITALRDMEPGRVLETFVQERAASEDYRKLLGVVALIRRDFKRLSDMLLKQGNVELRDAVTEILKKEEQERKLEAQAASVNGGAELTPAALNDGREEVAPEPTEKLVDATLREYRIDRIVLYIDDLDRCPPKQVVDVLQAIHLLLAFELFVVVVGVDARWIRHALRERYPALLSEEWDEDAATANGEDRLVKTATPQDYVEKIFQVPFWLKPMDDMASRKLLEGLIPDSQLSPTAGGNGDKLHQTGSAGGNIQSIRKSGLADSEHDLKETHPKLAAETEAQNKLAGETNGQAKFSGAGEGKSDKQQPKTADLELNPESLLLDVKERDEMIALSRVVGKTPRTLKRFVNVYRIIKAGLNGDQLDAFMGSGRADPEYRAVLVLLSVAHGAPDVAPAFFLELKQEHEKRINDKGNTKLKTFLKQMLPPPNTVRDFLKPAWSCLINDLTKALSDKNDIPLAVLRQWLPVVVRYTFQLGRLSNEVASQESSKRIDSL